MKYLTNHYNHKGNWVSNIFNFWHVTLKLSYKLLWYVCGGGSIILCLIGRKELTWASKLKVTHVNKKFIFKKLDFVVYIIIINPNSISRIERIVIKLRPFVIIFCKFYECRFIFMWIYNVNLYYLILQG